MNLLEDTITRQFYDYLKSQIIRDKNVFESKVCRTVTLSGKIVFINDNKYRGDVTKTGQMDGKGRFDWADGNYYQGDFKEDRITGKGTLAFKNCSKLIGSMLNGAPHGECRLMSKCIKYVGRYKYGKKCGQGSFFALDGTKEQLIFDGIWMDGAKYNGTRYYTNGNFKGQFQDNERYNGIYTHLNGETYVGEYFNNKFHGFGVYTWPQHNTSYAGYWQNGEKHGFGVIKLNELLVMTVWINNCKSGPGLIKCYNGDILISPQLYKENFLYDANLLATFSVPQLTELLTNPTESAFNDFIEQHQEQSLSFNLNVVSPFLINGSFINIHQSDKILQFIVDKYNVSTPDQNSSTTTKTVNEILNYEIINLRSLLAKLDGLLFTIFESRQYNRQINLWNLIVQVNKSTNTKTYAYNMLKMANDNFNLLIQNLNDANEPIAFYQFLKLLIYLAITIYGDEPCKNVIIGNISYCFLKLIRTVIKMFDAPLEMNINLDQFRALDREIHFDQYDPLMLREFVASAIKKRRILKWVEQELFQAIEAIIPRFQHNNFVLDFHIPIMPLEFYLMYRKLIEIALMRP